MHALTSTPKSFATSPVGVDRTLDIAQCLTGPGLSAEAADRLGAWAQELSKRGQVGITDLEHVLVARALRTTGVDAATQALLARVHADSVALRTGKLTDRVEPLPAVALQDRRARVLQNAVFEGRGVLAGYIPTVGQTLVAGAAVAAGMAVPAITLAAAAGFAVASAVEHQIHVHIMHPRPAVARLLTKHRKMPVVNLAANFFFIHKGIHHGESFLDDATTKWKDGTSSKADAVLRNVGLEEFGHETDYGLQLSPSGAIAGAVVGAAALGAAGLVAGLSAGAAVALGLPMVLMPFFPHIMHRFAHMSRGEAAEHLDTLEAKGGLRKLQAKLVRGIIKTRAFEAVARFHNQHHADDRRGVKSNMSMLAVADGLLFTGSRVGYDMLVKLWSQDAIGFPAAPATQPAA